MLLTVRMQINIQRAALDLTVALIPIKNFPYAQTDVPTTYDLGLLG